MTKSKRRQKPPAHTGLGFFRRMSITGEMDNPSSDRASAIVAAAVVENNLALAIMARLRILDTDEQKRLFENDHSLLRDFHSKIEMGFVLNLYGEKVRDDLHCIRRIRNMFAHNLDVRVFDREEVASLCDKLIAADLLDLPRGKTTPRNRRERYIDTTAHLAERFELDSQSEVRPASSLNKIGADY